MNANEQRLKDDQEDQRRQKLVELREQVKALQRRNTDLQLGIDSMSEEVTNAKKYTNCANVLGEINQLLGIDMFHEPADTTVKRVREQEVKINELYGDLMIAKRQLVYRGEQIDRYITNNNKAHHLVGVWKNRALVYFIWAVLSTGLCLGFIQIIWKLSHR